MRWPSSVRASLVEHQEGIVVRHGYDLLIEEPECCLIMPIDPSVIVFPRAVFLGVNPIQPFIQIDIERNLSLVTDGNSRQDVCGGAVSRIGDGTRP